ncbi:YbfB/YjiJ family MFS transporter [Paraburkholderia sp. Ac-20340]|uniref:YbfB/YjiJ family MFS transporter n=1 Tax=Paraburkholderia sp. Ac-20340 TaxID=2703888 RepID=UPI0019817F06|nr:YbfB/YjiJ family MFS transporter [Paraburkholderia sp. Ac-20340]MBN3853552.1 YbfB/YjiJ family MFS transporter [Paraburkholderia sp. Ac-20340]
MSTTSSTLGARAPDRLDAQALFATLAGLCGSFVAIGLARFAYTPLIPPLIQAHWFTASQAVTLGAANFAGYLLGALAGRPIAHRLGNRHALRWLMLTATLAFFACAFPLSVAWFFAWRLASGVAGGAIMVLVATSILPHVPPARRGFVSGMIFLGLGLGIAASGTVIPWFLHYGLRVTWMGLGAIALLLTAMSWFGWPRTDAPIATSAPQQAGTPHGHVQQAGALRVLYGQYAANALGLVPVMVLLVDYVARGLGQGAANGAHIWVLYGIAAIAGPIICGQVADRIGFRLTWRFALLTQAAAVALLALSNQTFAIITATLILGACTPGIVPLALGRIHELIAHDHVEQRAAWSRATTAFALFQALGGYGYSWLFSHTHENYALIFACGAVALSLAFIVDLLMSKRKT